MRGRLGKPAHLQNWIKTFAPLKDHESAFDVTFEWDEEMGVPGAFLIRNNHHNEFLLKHVTIEDVPGHGQVHFICDSWVYPADRYKNNRIFFANKVIGSLRLSSDRFTCSCSSIFRKMKMEILDNLCPLSMIVHHLVVWLIDIASFP